MSALLVHKKINVVLIKMLGLAVLANESINILMDNILLRHLLRPFN